MAAHVEYSNFSSGYAWAKCSDCGWRGAKHLGAGPLSNKLARKEADAHDAEAHASTFKLVGENTLTGHYWECEAGIATRAEADRLRDGYARLESDYKIAYRVEEEAEKAPAYEEADIEECEHGLSAWLCAGPMHYPSDLQGF